LHTALSNDVAMPASEQSNGRAQPPQVEKGVLGNLPRTRPQRATRGRLAARDAGVARGTREAEPPATAARRADAPPRAAGARQSRNGARPTGRTGAAGTAKRSARTAGGAQSGSRRRRAPTARGRAKGAAETAPLQGFETESERPSGPVQPPSGIELAASAAEMLGELTRAGVSAGERFFKDVLSRLPLS